MTKTGPKPSGTPGTAFEAMESANKALQSKLPELQKKSVELQLQKKARQAELSHAEDQHNQFLQLQHAHEQLEQDNSLSHEEQG